MEFNFVVHLLRGDRNSVYSFREKKDAVQFAAGAVILNGDFTTGIIYDKDSNQIGFVSSQIPTT